MTVAIATEGLGRKYRRTWGLQDCTFQIPEGKIAGLVGPNGAGKSTLLRLAAGLSRPSAGTVSIFGEKVNPNSPIGFPRVGYLDQERPLYGTFTVAETLKLGRKLNRQWDDEFARQWIERLAIPMNRRVKALSIGHQAQVALALCLAKLPDLLLLDEPASSLDPLARRQLWSELMDAVAARGQTILVSTHIIGELDPICNYLVLLSSSHVQLAGDIDDIKASHRTLIGPINAPIPEGATIIFTSSTSRQITVVVRGHIEPPGPAWQVVEPTLEEIVVAYLESGRALRVPGDTT